MEGATMRIYFSQDSDPMITDSVSGLNAIASKLANFLSGQERKILIAADTSGSPAPYDALLSGVEFEKGSGPIMVSLKSGEGLKVTGSVENLLTWCSHFKFPSNAEDGDHNHPENIDRPGYIDSRTLSVVIEVREEE